MIVGQPPALGNLVPRRRLLGALAGDSPGLLLLEAPGGYGKTSLALQYATSSRFEDVVWFDGGGREFTTRTLLQSLLWQSSQPRSSESGGGLCQPSGASLEHDLASLLSSAHWGRPTCLVLDNVLLKSPDSEIRPLENVARSSIGADVCLVITSRGPLSAPTGSRSLSLDADDLRFVQDEARALGRTYGLSDEQLSEAESLLAQASGHAALFAVLVRSLAIRGWPLTAKDLQRQLVQSLERLIESQVDSDGRRLLYAAALLKVGDSDDLDHVLTRGQTASRLRELTKQIPLLAIDDSLDGRVRFCMHELGCSFFLRLKDGADRLGAVFQACLDRLRAREDFARGLEVLLAESQSDGIEQWLECAGDSLLGSGAVPLVAEALERLPREVLVRRPRIMLLQAACDRLKRRFAESKAEAALAVELAEHEGENEVAVDSRVLLASLLIEAGRPFESSRVLEAALRSAASQGAPTRPILLSHLVAASAAAGDSRRCEHYFAQAKSGLRSGPESASCSGIVAASDLYRRCILFGDYAEVVHQHSSLDRDSRLNFDQRLSALINLATCNCFLGHLEKAEAQIEQARRLWSAYDPAAEATQVVGSMIELEMGRGDYAAVEREVEKLIESDHDVLGYVTALMRRSACRRIVGESQRSVADAKEARDVASRTEFMPIRWEADVELAASLLAAHDVEVARELAIAALGSSRAVGANAQALCAAMVVTEANRLLGKESEDALSEFRDYIVAGNAVWHIAMYTRAFPALLPAFARAVEVRALPRELLNLLKLDGASAAMTACHGVIPTGEYGSLLQRMGEDPSPESDARPPQCTVRLFGGLSVATADGLVRDSDWRKRKARLLFAMLVVRKGKDVPREQLLEYLWPDMDSERAIANFYVVWNNLKRALSPSLERGKPSPYVRAAGGVCRVDDILVCTDLDEFEQCLLDARRADSQGQGDEVIAAARRLAEIYRGDLLPGDIYDDWFAPLRERCRQEFSDAILRAATLLESDGDYAGALQLLRQALTHDAWREDLYQATLRCQIAAGQRSAAIDTYMTCMHKLADDLGLDPSAETRKLYERVLAMEGPAENGYAV